MGKVSMAILGLIVGIVLGVLGAMTLGAGAMVGVGAGAGIATGICSTVRAAQEEGFMNAAQVDRVLSRAAKDMSAATGQPPSQEAAGSAAACDKLFARLNASK